MDYLFHPHVNMIFRNHIRIILTKWNKQYDSLYICAGPSRLACYVCLLSLHNIFRSDRLIRTIFSLENDTRFVDLHSMPRASRYLNHEIAC